MNRIVTIHLVSSVDGFIATKDNSINWFETRDFYEAGVEEVTPEAIAQFLSSIDCYIIGARTYELTLQIGWPYGDTRTVVLTHQNFKSERSNVESYRGDLKTLLNERLSNCKNIWVAGGARVARDFIEQGLADDLRLSILPIMLGDGLRLFDQMGSERLMHLKKSTAYQSGLVELWYAFMK